MATKTLINVTGTNEAILNGIKNNASLQYQNRIPYADKANLADVAKSLWDNPPARNEFVDALLNQIGLIVARTLLWSNPLAVFKLGQLEYGDVIEEVAVGLVEANIYDPKAEYLGGENWAQVLPEIKAAFHKINRQVFYKVTVNEAMLRRAFTQEGGLSKFVTDMMSAPMNSDQVDEYKITAQLLSSFHENGGFFKVQTPDLNDPAATAADSEANAKWLLKQIRAWSDRLQFVSTAYNSWGMPTFAPRDELLLITTPEANASMDVDALAAAFNIDRAAVPARTIVLPGEDIGIPGVQAILTTEKLLVLADTLIENRSIQNPAGLTTNHFLHHHGIYSVSPLVPAILFWTGEGDSLVDVVTPVTSMGTFSVTDANGAPISANDVTRGELYTVNVKAVTTPVGGSNDAVILSVDGELPLSPFTRIFQSGTLQIGLDEDNTSLTVTGVSEDNPAITGTLALDVEGDKLNPWTNPEVLTDDDADGLLEVVPEAVPSAPVSGANKNKVTIPQPGEGYDYKDGATTVNGQTLTLAANKTITAAPKAGYEIKTGATASWTLVFTA